MSFFGLGGGNAGAPQLSSEQKIKAAENELDMVTRMFNQLLDSCYRKCFDKNYDNGELTKNESLCVDRCVTKYFAANVKVGESMQELGQNGNLGRPTP
ncbi:DEKNAAC102791 [Brettanomyces naardenensis]|uniref:Mitochondrial import inner membrane translocase subunit n=1 Tax=Brettanomyces naardenensis TaxID=13370 RepID=A0A448YLE5_BRENA|nr:DEKNAAC102791 [Brettanomyces naardenensis]